MDQPQCDHCGKVLVKEHIHICPLCGDRYCFEHKEPEAHNCIKIGSRGWNIFQREREIWAKKNPRVALPDNATIDYEQIRLAHELTHSKSKKKGKLSGLQFMSTVLIIIVVIYLLKYYLI